MLFIHVINVSESLIQK